MNTLRDGCVDLGGEEAALTVNEVYGVEGGVHGVGNETLKMARCLLGGQNQWVGLLHVIGSNDIE